MVAEEPQQHLRWEARQRPFAAVAALVAGVLGIAAELWSAAVFRDAPRVPVTRSLQHALEPGALGSSSSERIPFYVFYDAHGGQLIGASTLRAIGYVGIALALTYLAVAVRARRAEMAKLVLYLPAVGGLLVAISVLLGTVGSATAVTDFLAGPRTVDAARAVGRNSLIVTAGFVGLAGSLALASAFALVALHAMRSGLLTRAMGALGILSGVLVLFPLGLLAVVIQNIWLMALGALILGVWPGGVPPAWRTGRAEPWPSRRRPAPPEETTEDAAAAAAGERRAGPAPQGKGKRKRRA